ncbi:hypothetical protein AVEN_91705-1 [Araneus ventricosus]|uniref:Uncharacterized protein n=1 Tax=Araneus ventricosus TaxID=182803 RepID=A0A4Y2HGY9_ARAVE|nr:hypothetical protein AVEN_91705-1 [Araneus ventricosus]
MKCPVKVQLCLCHECKCSDCCHNFPNSDSCENEPEKSYDMFDLLAHNIPTCTPKRTISKLNRLPTTYRNDYCRRKQPHSPTKILLPHPALHIPNQKMYCGTTHRSDFKPYKDKEGKDCRGKIVLHKDNLTCSKDKFEGKSEAKSSFSYPIPKKVFGPNASSERLFKVYPTNGLKKTYDVKMSDSTAYKSSYKRPKELPKTNICKPKPNIVLKLEPPFEHTSQYQNDYKRPAQTKREVFKKTPVFHPPSIPMEDKTTYKSEFYYKIPEESKRKNWNPNHRIYETAAGQCACSCHEHLKNEQCRTHCCCFHKENDSSLLIKCNIIENCQCYERGDFASGEICSCIKNSECNNRCSKNAGKKDHILNHQINLHKI